MYRKVEESQTLLINTQTKNLISQNKDIIKFGFGQSPFMPPDLVVQALEKSSHHKEYSSVQGDLELRELIAEFHAQHNGLKVKPNNILIAPGSKVLIFNILLAFEKADVLIPAPAWVSYAPQANLVGHNILKIETTYHNRWRITPNAIRSAAKNKQHDVSIMILNYPGNPDGLTYTEAELKSLAECAREFNLLVISDEIYGLLNHSLNHLSFANYYPEKTITTSGLSKWCGAGGWRFGTMFLYDDVEPEFKQALIGIGSETYSCAPTPVQIAAKTAYKSFEDIKEYIEWQVKILNLIGIYCSNKLNAAEIRVQKPEGGFYLFPDFSHYKEKLNAAGINTSNEMCQRILEEVGVALLPASAFGFEDTFLAVRLAYVDFVPSTENKEIDVENDYPRIKKGIDAIINWIQSF